MNNNIDGIFHSANHDGNGVEKKEQPLNITGWVIDDNEGIRDFFSSNMADVKGMSLESFSSSGEVLDALKKGAPDFFLLDGNLGKDSLDGCELTKQIRTILIDGKRPVIFAFTNDPDKREKMLENGADLSLNKDNLMGICDKLSDIEGLKNTLEEIKAKKDGAELQK